MPFESPSSFEPQRIYAERGFDSDPFQTSKIWGPIMFIAFGFLMIALLGYKALGDKRIFDTGAHVQGTVTQVESHSEEYKKKGKKRTRTVWNSTVSYRDLSGTMSARVFKRQYAKGQQVPLVIDRTDPEAVYTEKELEDWKDIAGVMAGFVLISWIAGGILLVKGMRLRSRASEIVKHNHQIAATVLEFKTRRRRVRSKKNRRWRVNNLQEDMESRLIAEWRDPRSGKTFIFESIWFKGLVDASVKGNPVKLLVNPNDPHQYYFHAE